MMPNRECPTGLGQSGVSTLLGCGEAGIIPTGWSTRGTGAPGHPGDSHRTRGTSTSTRRHPIIRNEELIWYVFIMYCETLTRVTLSWFSVNWNFGIVG
jgi:hypothetical protein